MCDGVRTRLLSFIITCKTGKKDTGNFIFTNKCHHIKLFRHKMNLFIQENLKKGCKTLLRKDGQNVQSHGLGKVSLVWKESSALSPIACFFHLPQDV